MSSGSDPTYAKPCSAVAVSAARSPIETTFETHTHCWYEELFGVVVYRCQHAIDHVRIDMAIVDLTPQIDGVLATDHKMYWVHRGISSQ